MALGNLSAGSLLGALGAVSDFSGIIGGLINTIGGNSISHLNYELEKQTNELNQQNVRETNANNYLMQKEANETNIQLQREMNDFNYRMWQENNEYNSPAAQLERARSAGINPNFVMGSPVASSPVQQTSIPAQQASRDVAANLKAPHLESNYLAERETISSLSHLLSGLSRLPFVKEQLNLVKEQVRGQRVDNDAKEYDLQGKKDADAFYNGAAFYRHHDGSYITGDDFEKLSDNEKENYLNQSEPYVTINGEKKPNYDAYRMPFKNKAEFEAYKDVLNFPNFKANISADMQQNKLREAVAKGQLQNNDVVQHLIDMPTMQYKQIYHSLQKLIQEYNWNEETHEIRKHILELNEQQIENAVDHDIFTYIDKIFAKDDMSVSDWFKLAFAAMASFVHR